MLAIGFLVVFIMAVILDAWQSRAAITERLLIYALIGILGYAVFIR